jgi:hypothetical protein
LRPTSGRPGSTRREPRTFGWCRTQVIAHSENEKEGEAARWAASRRRGSDADQPARGQARVSRAQPAEWPLQFDYGVGVSETLEPQRSIQKALALFAPLPANARRLALIGR